MDFITDLTEQAVSIIGVLQDVCRKSPLHKKQNNSLRLWEAIGDRTDWGERCDDPIRARFKELLWVSNTDLLRDVSVFDDLSFQIAKGMVRWLQGHFERLSGQQEMQSLILGVSYGTVYSPPHEWRVVIRGVLYAMPEERVKISSSMQYLPIQVILALGGKKSELYHQRIYQVWDDRFWERDSQSGSKPVVAAVKVEWEKPADTTTISDQEPIPGKEKISADDTLCSKDLALYKRWWTLEVTKPWDENRKAERWSIVEHLLTHEEHLLLSLTDRCNPIPFETLFTTELDEIERGRKYRKEADEDRWTATRDRDPFKTAYYSALKNEERKPGEEKINITEPGSRSAFDIGIAIESLAPDPGEKLPPPQKKFSAEPPEVPGSDKDPLKRARNLKLVGLAFSGGGIRSATFNLGVLQQLAERNILSNVDYLSTVSGGGYIGTWAASWIKRAGSVQKVEDRLSPSRSADPMAEEVRPIRWLRMYSNYLAPNAGIMSIDSWTLGVTWLRNTLINQLLLLLLLCSLLSGITLFYTIWTGIGNDESQGVNIFLTAVCLLLPVLGCSVAGVGMNVYNREQPLRALFYLGRSRYLSLVLVALAILSAFFISIWIYARTVPEMEGAPSDWLSYPGRFKTLAPAAGVGGGAVMLIAFLGRYYDSEESGNRSFVLIAVIGSSLLATLFGWALMAGVWSLFPVMAKWVSIKHEPVLLFIVGVPLIMEVFSAVVIARMALMGRLFPDARREWWGRMGAITHRFSLLWILVSVAGLLLLDVFRAYANTRTLQALLPLFGGWAGIVGFGVKLAYSSTSDKDKGVSGFKEFFIRFVPYLFMVGFVLAGCYLLAYISDLFGGWWDKAEMPELGPIPSALLLTLLLAFLTVLFSWRVGVNEFSLHYFYRNRLVRAYLGATRRRAERSKTANSFTGFDLNDDEKLGDFQFQNGYHGPYPLINTALNATSVTELDRQDRKAESFVFSPLFCGYDFSPNRSSSYNKVKGFEYGYRPTNEYGYRKGPTIGTAMAISGAAVNPNMGYHSSAATAFLLTVFNVRMGWWMGNPRRDTWTKSDPELGLAYIVNDLIGKSNIDSDYVCLSDGGHFDNMGLYELIRRRCTYIILSDAEEDQKASCEGLANAIRRCRIDFGTQILIDTKPATVDRNCHVVKGKIQYPGDDVPSGTLIYIKTVLTGNESPDIKEYAMGHPTFPNESTGDQFFDEAQFESYRQLGYHSLLPHNSSTIKKNNSHE